jgi:capsular polysaccharide biosynthesis protein
VVSGADGSSSSFLDRVGRTLRARPDLVPEQLVGLAGREDAEALRRVELVDADPAHASDAGELVTGDASGLPPGVAPDVIRYLVLEGARVEADSSAALVGDRLLVGSGWRTPGIDLTTDWIRSHRGERALIAERAEDQVVRLDKGLFLGGHYATEWYHWLIDTLPRLVSAKRLPRGLKRIPVLVPSEVLERPRLRDALAVLTDPDLAIALEPATTYEVARLVWIDGHRPIPPAGAPVRMTGTAGEVVLDGFRSAVRSAVKAPRAPQAKKRVILTRDVKRGVPQPFSQRELVRIAAKERFVEVKPDGLSFAEQVKLFAQSSLVIGGHGSHWTGVLFAGPGSRGLIVESTEEARQPYFAPLVELAGMDLETLLFPVEPGYPHRPGAKGKLDPERFREALARLVAKR